MSTAILPMSKGLPAEHHDQPPARLEANALEHLMLTGDLSKLTPADQAVYYRFKCESLGLDPASTPFAYMVLQGKKILYALKSCTDQLTAKRKISLSILERNVDQATGICEVTCRATMQDGRICEDVGVVSVAGLKGEMLSNAIMKAVTKAKRRTVLSACGLGMLDESEIGTIPADRLDGQPQGQLGGGGYSKTNQHPRNTGYGNGEFLHPDRNAEYDQWAKSLIAKSNEKWGEYWADKLQAGKGLPSDIPKELTNHFQFTGHMMKWVRESAIIDPAEIREDEKAAHGPKYLAIVYHQDADSRSAMRVEAKSYLAKLFAMASDKVFRNHPDLAPDGWQEQQEEARREAEAEDAIDVELDPAEASQEPIPDAARPQPDDDPDFDPTLPEGKGEAYEGPANFSEASPPANAPRTGKALFAWCKDQEKTHGVGLIKFMNGWAKDQDFPGRMVDWDAEQAALGYAEAVRAIREKAGN